MKKTIKLLSMATLMLALGTSSCKKYEEGGNNFRLEKKLTEKAWDLLYVDKEVSQYVDDSKLLEMQQIYFTKDNDFIINNKVVGTYEFDSYKTITITSIDSVSHTFFRLMDKKDTTLLPFSEGNGYKVIFTLSGLKNDELTLFKYKNIYYEKH